MVTKTTRRLTQNAFNEQIESHTKGNDITYCFRPEENEILDLALMVWNCFSIDILSASDYLVEKDYYHQFSQGRTTVKPIDKLRSLRELFEPQLIKKACQLIVGYDSTKKEVLKQIIIALNNEN